MAACVRICTYVALHPRNMNLDQYFYGLWSRWHEWQLRGGHPRDVMTLWQLPDEVKNTTRGRSLFSLGSVIVGERGRGRIKWVTGSRGMKDREKENNERGGRESGKREKGNWRRKLRIDIQNDILSIYSPIMTIIPLRKTSSKIPRHFCFLRWWHMINGDWKLGALSRLRRVRRLAIQRKWSSLAERVRTGEIR